MRICFISRRYFPAISGMSVYAENLLRHLVALGHDVTMISQYRGDAAGVAVYGGGPPPEVPGVRVIGLEALGEQQVSDGSPADFERDLHEIVSVAIAEHEAGRFDVIHAQYGYPTGLAALEVSRRTGLPNVVSIQGGDGHWVGGCCPPHREAMRAVLLHSNQILIGSKSFAVEVQENHGVPESVFEIVPGATDIDRFRPTGHDEAADVASLGAPVFLYHGRVDLRKGLGELIDAMKEVIVLRPHARLVISGIGPDADEVQHRVQSDCLSHCVEMTGYCPYAEAPAVYRRGDVFVSPTYSEGFSNTILEAMASGLAVISTDTVGVRDCIEHERNGLLVPTRDAAALAAAMIRLFDDAPLRKRLAEEGLRDVHSHYCWPVVAKQIEACYQRVLGREPDNRWVAYCDPTRWQLRHADLSCRFRTAPHLL